MDDRLESCLAVIPARGGSVGIPRKNLAEVGGQPLITWTIRAALDAPGIDRVVVSTDDDEIAEVSRTAGAEVPFRRPTELASGDVHSVHVVLDAVARLRQAEDYESDAVAMLLPTAPLRTWNDLEEALRVLRASGAPSVIGVARLDRHLTNLRWLRSGKLVPLQVSGSYNEQRQGQEPLYGVNGAVFIARTSALLLHGTFHMEGAAGYVMPQERSVDVDAPRDLAVVRAAFAEGGPGSA